MPASEGRSAALRHTGWSADVGGASVHEHEGLRVGGEGGLEVPEELRFATANDQ